MQSDVESCAQGVGVPLQGESAVDHVHPSPNDWQSVWSWALLQPRAAPVQRDQLHPAAEHPSLVVMAGHSVAVPEQLP
jgi:hypothetical protein